MDPNLRWQQTAPTGVRMAELTDLQLKFLKTAAAASCFDETFELGTVSTWMQISGQQGRMVLDELIELALVNEGETGKSILTQAGRQRARQTS
jgi:hypothetical protein